jgi:2'-5' RNA ligase
MPTPEELSAHLTDVLSQFPNVPRPIAEKLIGVESRGDPLAVSYKNAKGMMQLMPATVEEMGGGDPLDWRSNISMGVGYLSKQINKFGSLPVGIAAFHTGPGNVQADLNAGGNGIPDNSDGITRTPDYVRKVMGEAGPPAARVLAPNSTTTTDAGEPLVPRRALPATGQFGKDWESRLGAPLPIDWTAATPKAEPSIFSKIGNEFYGGWIAPGEDVRSLLQMTLGDNVVWGIEKLGEVMGMPSLDAMREKQIAARTPEWAAAAEKRWDLFPWEEGAAAADPKSWAIGILGSAPEMVLGMVPSMAAGSIAAKMAAKTALEGAARSGVLAQATRAGVAKGLTVEAAQAAAAKEIVAATPSVETAAKIGNWLGGGGGEGAFAAGQSYRSVREEIEKMDTGMLYEKSAAFRELVDGYGGDREAAKAALAKNQGTQAAVLAFIGTMPFAGLGDAMIFSAFRGKVAGNRFVRMLKTGGVETGEELVQNPLQQLGENVSAQAADPSIDTMRDVWHQTFGGAAAGLGMGLAGGAVSRGHEGGKQTEFKPPQAPGTQPPPAAGPQETPPGAPPAVTPAAPEAAPTGPPLPAGMQTGDVGRADGNPFLAKLPALNAIKRLGLEDSHDIAQVGTGWVLRPKTPTEEIPNALQEHGTGEVLQREPGQTGEPGSISGRVEPGQQGNEPAATGPAVPGQAEAIPTVAPAGEVAPPAPGMLPGDIGRPNDGLPFAARKAAGNRMELQGLGDTHAVAEIGDKAFVIRPKGTEQAQIPAAPAAPEAQIPAVTTDLEARLRAERDSLPKTRQKAFGAGTFDAATHSLVADDGTHALQWRPLATKPEGVIQLEKREAPAKVEAAKEVPGAGPQEFNSTQVALPSGLAKDVKTAAKAMIAPADRHPEKGLEDRPHVTVKYGLHENAPEAVRKLIESEPPITGTIGKLEVFQPEGKDYDVLVARVDSPDLHRLNAKIASLPHTDTFPEYRPHITLGYGKRGTLTAGGKNPLEGREFKISTLEFSDQNEKVTEIPLKGEVAKTALAPRTQLYAEWGSKRHPVESVADAQAKWTEFRDKSGAGVSQVGNGVRVTDETGKLVARISYNGRVWDKEDGTKVDKPAESQGEALDQWWAGLSSNARTNFLLGVDSKKKAGVLWSKLPPDEQKAIVAARDKSVAAQAKRVADALAEWKVGDWTVPMGAISNDTEGHSVYHSGLKGTIVAIDPETAKADVELRSIYVRKGEPTVIRVHVTELEFDYSNPQGRASKVPPEGDPREAERARVAAGNAAPPAGQTMAEDGREKTKPATRYEYAAPLKGESAAEVKAKMNVVDALNGKITVDELVKKLRASGLPNGTLTAITERLGDRMRVDQQHAMLAEQEASKPRSEKQLDRDAELAKRGRNRKILYPKTDSLIPAIIKLGGLSNEYRADVVGEKNVNPRLPFVGSLFRKGGLGLDDMAGVLEGYNYLTENDADQVTGASNRLVDLIQRELAGNKTYARGVRGEEVQFEQLAERREEIGLEQEAAAQAHAAGDEFAGIATPEALFGDAGLDPHSPVDLAAVDLVAQAAAIDDGAVERLSIQHADDEAGFLAAIRAFLKDHEDAHAKVIAQGSEASPAPASGHATVAPETFTLTAQTNAEIVAAEKKAKAAEDAKQAAAAKDAIDEGVGGFQLTGSSRQRDVGAAAGQAEFPTAETPPAAEAAEIAKQVEAIEPALADPATEIETIGKGESVADFGPKIGGARKDTATPLGKRGTISKVVDERPAWARPYIAMEQLERSSSYSFPMRNAEQPKKTGKWELMRANRGASGAVSRASRTVFDTEEDALAAIPLAEVARNHRVYSYKDKDGEQKQGIFRQIGERKRALVKGGFATEEDAMKAMASDPVPIIEHKFQFPEKPWLDRIERVGEPKRKGDVTTKMFQEAFGFRAGEFGNWNMGSDGQAALNHAYDALHDLADTIGVPAKALSLNGELAVAFGARGTGGVGAAAAHYGPDKVVINLTKIRGAGSLAHEWFHALDDYLTKSADNAKAQRARTVLKEGRPYATYGFPYNTDARPELIAAFKHLVDTMTAKKEGVAVDENVATRRLTTAQESLKYNLDGLRSEIAKKAEYGQKKGAATPAQLKAWDALAERAMAGDNGADVQVPPPKGAGRFSFGYGSSEVVRVLNAIYKEVRGRSFDRADPDSQGRRLHWHIKSVKDMQDRVASAQKGTIEERRTGTEYLNEANKIDGLRASDYWSTRHEMGARAFESYIFDQLAAAQKKSDYLVHAVENKYYAAFDMKPYPEGAERAAIDAAFDDLFNVIQTKETDKGIALYEPNGAYNKTGEPTPPDPFSDPYEPLKTRPGTTDAQKDDGRAALAAAERRIFGPAGSGRHGAALLGSRISKDFRADGGVTLVGQQVRGPQDLATIAQVLRDPRFETFRVFYVDSADRVIGEGTYSSRLPGAVHLPADLDQHVAADKLRFGKGQFGHVRYWLLHNHPSGLAEASGSDRFLTDMLKQNVPGFVGHVIIDHNEFHQILADGTDSTVPAPELNSKALAGSNVEAPHPMLGRPITGPSQMVAIAKELQTRDGYVTVIATGGPRGLIGLVTEIPVPSLQPKTRPESIRMLAAVRRAMLQAGTGGYLFAVTPTSAMSPEYALLRKSGVFGDVIAAGDENSVAARGDMAPGKVPVSRIDKTGRKSPDLPSWYAKEQEATYSPDQGEAMFSRATRREGLPAETKQIASSRNTNALKGHADYIAAKAGDPEAAERLVRDLVNEDDLDEARKAFGGGALFAWPHAEEASGLNALPAALAARYAEATDGALAPVIVQTNHAFHTGAKAMERLIARPVFDGEVVSGARYVLADDVSTMGGTLAELGDHIRAGGGEVIGTVVLTDASRTPTMQASKQQINQVEQRYGDAVREIFNIEPAALTAAEAGYILSFRDADSLRNRAGAAERERDARLHAKGIQPAEKVEPPGSAQSRANEARPSGGLSASGVHSQVDSFTSEAWPERVVVQHVADLPFKASPDTRGASHGGKLYFVADNLFSPVDVEHVAFHELFHDQLKREPALRGEFDRLVAINPNLRKAAAAWRAANGRDGRSEFAHRFQSYEEALADLGQRGANLTGLGRFLAAVQTWLRKMGLTRMADAMEGFTDAEALAYVNDVLRGSQATAERPAGDRQAAASRKAPIWRSALAESVAAKAPFSKAGVIDSPQLARWLEARTKDGTFKKDELEWSGLTDFLKLERRVTRDQVGAFLDENGTRLDERVLGEKKAESDGDTVESLTARLAHLGYTPDIDYESRLQGLTRDRDDMYFVFDEGTREWTNADPDSEPDEGDTVETLHSNVAAPATRLGELRDNESNYSGPRPGEPKHAQWQQPGGSNYRELLITLPRRETTTGDVAKRLFGTSILENLSDSQRDRLVEEMRNTPNGNRDFRQGHYSDVADNVLVHVRMNERTDAEGKPVLFIEEIQSDWAQKGRKEGFNDNDKRAKLAAERAAIQARSGGDMRNAGAADLARMDEITPEYDRLGAAPPPAPFVQKTEAWVALALKRAIRYASENGMDAVAWTTGDQQNKRYSLSSQVDGIKWDPVIGTTKQDVKITTVGHGSIRFTVDGGKIVDHHTNVHAERLVGKGLDEVLGKEVAEKIAAKHKGELSGEGLDIGGSGMRGFYDRIIPSVANDILKKLGGERVRTFKGVVENGVQFQHYEGPIPTARDVHEKIHEKDHGATLERQLRSVVEAMGQGVPFRTAIQEHGSANLAELFGGKLVQTAKVGEQQGFDITPAMREKALAGMPMFSRAIPGLGPVTREGIQDRLAFLLNSSKTLNWWHKSVGTMYHIAETVPAFKPVFRLAQKYINDTNQFSMDAAQLAPDLLPTLKNIRDVLPNILRSKDKQAPSRADFDAVAKAIFDGTLEDKKVYSDEELAAKGLTAKQVDLYRQARAALDRSLDDLAASSAAQQVRGTPLSRSVIEAAKADPVGAPGIYDAFLRPIAEREQAGYRRAVDKRTAELKAFDKATAPLLKAAKGPGGRLTVEAARKEQRAELEARHDFAVKAWETTRDISAKMLSDVSKTFDRAKTLKAEGYAPLMRFGQYTVFVQDPETKESIFFGMYESQAEQRRMERRMKEEYPDAEVYTNIMSKEAYKLYGGISLDSLKLFAHAIGAEESAVFQQYLRLAVNNRSALKRLMHRQGTPGFEQDVTRVLATFVTSNARLASKNYHLGEMREAVNELGRGDVKDHAIKLLDYVQNPTEEASAIRGLLFVNYLGGNIASALVNMTQPVTQTLAYLSQFTGPAGAAKALTGAARAAAGGPINEPALRAALLQAEKEGITEPHEIHALYAESIRTLGGSLPARKFLRAWGSLFSLAEAWNRKITFIAAWRAAQDMTPEQFRKAGVTDAYAFAEKAVHDTQGVYSRANRPVWARSGVGATLFTFKQFSIAYVEFVKRLPPREQALAIAILIFAAGLQGLPFAEDLEDLVDTIGQAIGYNTNSKRWLHDLAPDFMMHGISGVTGFPVDIGRLGFGNMVPGTAILKRSEVDKTRDVNEAFGPIGGFVQGIGRAWDAAVAGDKRGVAVSMAPTAVQNAMKAIDMMQTGHYRDFKGRNVIETTGADAAAKAIGLQPQSVAVASRKARDIQQDIGLAKRVQGDIAGLMAEGRFENDPSKVERARADLVDWNEKNPDSRIRIDMAGVNQRVKAMRALREERIAKTAPKGMRPAVREALQ